MKKLAMFVVLSMLCCFYAATSLAAQTNYWKFHIVADERVDAAVLTSAIMRRLRQ